MNTAEPPWLYAKPSASSSAAAASAAAASLPPVAAAAVLPPAAASANRAAARSAAAAAAALLADVPPIKLPTDAERSVVRTSMSASSSPSASSHASDDELLPPAAAAAAPDGKPADTCRRCSLALLYALSRYAPDLSAHTGSGSPASSSMQTTLVTHRTDDIMPARCS